MGFGERLLATNIHAHELVPVIMLSLQEKGLSVFKTFSLDSACAPLNTPCPHHGTTPCSCRLVILILVTEQDVCHSLIVHGSDGESEIAILDADNELVEEVRRIVLDGIDLLGLPGEETNQALVRG
ncbi:MAG: hypothetical protein P1P76_04450 [Anaerolineales bacterium]|nr:hypothetical protein [Anaerolineales bacterium]